MLKKNYRLTKSKDIQQTSMRGRSFFNPLFVLKYRAASLVEPRFGFIVSTKVSKRAVERNRIKRVAREQIRSIITDFKTGDYVIIVKSKASGKTPTELRASLSQLCQSSKLLNL